MKRAEWDHLVKYANKHWLGKNVVVSYAYVKQTCYYCKHKETRYKEVAGTLKKFVGSTIHLDGGVLADVVRHKNRIYYVKVRT